MKITALAGQAPGKSKFVEFQPGKVRLVGVFDRGVPYDPPKGKGGEETSPVDVARTALEKIARVIEQAKQLKE
jgi:hypothetical protein